MSFIYFSAAILLLQPNLSIADTLTSQSASTKTSTPKSTVNITKKRNSIIVDHTVNKKLNALAKKRFLIKVTADVADSQFFDATALFIFNDTLPAIEITGACGNKVCEKLIFRFNASKSEYYIFFRGAYSSISIFENHLIEAGASGCCSFEYHAYKIPKTIRSISGPPQASISVTNMSDGTGLDQVECRFKNSAGEVAKPPNDNWLKFCEVYGESYQLKH